MAAPIKGNTTSANPTPAANFYQFTHNSNSGTGGLLVIQLTMSNARTYTGCNYGGVSIILFGESANWKQYFEN